MTNASVLFKARPKAIIVGGSLGGLFAALGLGLFYADFLSVTGVH